MPGFAFLGFIPYDPKIVDADLEGKSVLDSSPQVKSSVKEIAEALLK